MPLYAVLEFSKTKWVDVVTACIPRDPHRIVPRGCLANILRYDKYSGRAKIVGTK